MYVYTQLYKHTCVYIYIYVLTFAGLNMNLLPIDRSSGFKALTSPPGKALKKREKKIPRGGDMRILLFLFDGSFCESRARVFPGVAGPLGGTGSCISSWVWPEDLHLA